MPRARLNRQCKIAGCPGYVTAKGYCNRHYCRLRKRGNAEAPARINYPERQTELPLARFQRFYIVATPPESARPDLGPCWLWTSTLDKGYGHFYYEGKPLKAYAWSYEHFVGPVPEGLELDHLCRIRRCVNFEHLEAVTHLVNIQRGVIARKRDIQLPLAV